MFFLLMMLIDVSNSSPETNKIKVGIRAGDKLIDICGNVVLHTPEYGPECFKHITVVL